MLDIETDTKMRGQSSLKQETKQGMELEKLSKLEEESHLSGAYIRSLVKQLTTSRTKDSMHPKDHDCVVGGDISPGRHLTKHAKVSDTQQAQQLPQPHQHKKQVRRRLHTSRPYQERLLNMAEARREIVTALKFHRAAMKQASEQQRQQQQQAQEQQQQPSESLQPPLHPSFERDGRMKSRRNPRIYPSCTASFSNHLDDFSYSSFSHPPPTVPNPFSWPAASSIAPPFVAESPNFILPNQTLGLNLNFHDFNNLDATLCLNNNSSLYLYSSPSLSSSPPLSVATDQEVSSVAISQGEGTSALVDHSDPSAATHVGGGLHTAMDDEGMAELRSLGEQYQMEWNDTMNLVTSAWWFKFLKNMEHGATEAKTGDDAYHVFDEVMEFPAWLNANENSLEQCSEDYFQDPTLPCMDIGDIEGIDEDWLA